jgi:sigma-B regulation protein RsbU (phosphoserine phosphatase)
LMSSARALLRSAVRGAFRLDEVLGRMNDQFARDSDGAIFMSLQLIELDDRERVLRFANAGHTAPLLLRAEGAIETLPGDGLALGIEEGMPYDVSEPVQMNSGDVLVLITDGILEARRGDEVFGRERLARAVLRSRDGDAAGVIRAIHDDVIEFTGSANQDDDVTLVVVKAR